MLFFNAIIKNVPSAGQKQMGSPSKLGSAQVFFLFIWEFFLAIVTLGLLWGGLRPGFFIKLLCDNLVLNCIISAIHIQFNWITITVLLHPSGPDGSLSSVKDTWKFPKKYLKDSQTVRNKMVWSDETKIELFAEGVWIFSECTVRINWKVFVSMFFSSLILSPAVVQHLGHPFGFRLIYIYIYIYMANELVVRSAWYPTPSITREPQGYH